MSTSKENIKKDWNAIKIYKTKVSKSCIRKAVNILELLGYGSDDKSVSILSKDFKDNEKFIDTENILYLTDSGVSRILNQTMLSCMHEDMRRRAQIVNEILVENINKESTYLISYTIRNTPSLCHKHTR
jgi:hypothetical protein